MTVNTDQRGTITMAKWVYLFREGNADMRNLLGGKGANLAEMTNLGLPIPPGFTVTTEACTDYYNHGRSISEEIQTQIFDALALLEEKARKEVRRYRESAACVGTKRSESFDARYDGYDPESGLDRYFGRRLCQTDRQSEICL